MCGDEEPELHGSNLNGGSKHDSQYTWTLATDLPTVSQESGNAEEKRTMDKSEEVYHPLICRWWTGSVYQPIGAIDIA